MFCCSCDPFNAPQVYHFFYHLYPYATQQDRDGFQFSLLEQLRRDFLSYVSVCFPHGRGVMLIVFVYHKTIQRPQVMRSGGKMSLT